MSAAIGWQAGWWSVLMTTFMRHAFVAGTLVAVAAGVVGYFVVVRQDAFAAHALAHIGFPGATGAVLVGAPVLAGLAVFTLLGAVLIALAPRRAAQREVVTGTVLSIATGLGILFSSLASQSARGVTNVLFGNLLAVTSGQLAMFAAFTALVLVVIGLTARPLLYASIDPSVAAARGLPVRALSVGFLLLLALVVTMAVQVVGTLLLFALVVTPAATALRLTARPAAVVALSVGGAVGALWLGLVLSAMFDLPPSFPVVAIVGAAWIAVTIARRERHRLAVTNAGHDGHHAHGATDGHRH